MCQTDKSPHKAGWQRCFVVHNLSSFSLRSAYADPGALNRAEWVKFVAVFFNKEVEANRLFNTISTVYSKLKAAATEAAAAATGPVANNRVAWISKFGDTLTMSYAVYKQQLVTVSGQLSGQLGWSSCAVWGGFVQGRWVCWHACWADAVFLEVMSYKWNTFTAGRHSSVQGGTLQFKT